MEQKEQLGTGLEIAVIGMAVRFPGAKNIDEFWENLKNGVESIHFFTEEELFETGISPSLLANPNYVKAYGTLGDYEYFDTIFFGYTPKEAEIMDPQVRIFHECSWAALEDAGFAPGTYDGLIGLYAGATPNIHWEARAILAGKIDEMGFFAVNQLIQKDFLSMCVSYKLNLKGPSFVLHTACSTSLVAIHLACQGILNGECDIALAGGVSISNLDKGGYIYEEGMISSPDGHCRAFDAGAKGIVGGDGIGIVVLKTLVDAVADRDNIYAVVKGSAINNDGTRRVGFTTPSVAGQAEVIKMAMQAAAVEPESISYIETHGTATVLGDPVEIEGLKLAFNTRENGFCGIGSVKTNIGHLGAPAGVAGFIKVILALKHRQIPPTLNFEIPNPRINFVESPFYVNTELLEWKNNLYPLRAGVSSFGIGGTNAHVIVEEWPLDTKEKIKVVKYRLFLLSARTGPVLSKIKENLALYLKSNPDVNLEDVTYTLQVGRRHFNHRWMAVCSTGVEAIAALTSPDAGETHTVSPEEEKHEPLKIQHDAGKDRLMEIGRLWLYGQKIDSRSLYPGEKPYRISLPTYPFEKQKYWITSESIDSMLERGKRIDPVPDISGWFYVPTWKRSTLEPYKSKDALIDQQWLVFADDSSLGNLLVNRLKETYHHVVVVKRGSSFSHIDNHLFTLNPREYHQYENLIDMLRIGERLPDKIIHLWNITGDCENIEEYHPGLISFEKSQEQGFFSLFHIARALGKQNYSHNIRIYVLTNHVQEVFGNEPSNPVKSTILGLLKVIPQEYAGIRCSSIDIELPQPGISGEEVLVDLLLEEFTIDSAKMEAEVAYRNNQRWVQIFDSLHLETPPQEQLKLRIKQKGVFLITGGLGKIGLMFAELFVKRAGASLIMTGRSPLPSGKESFKIKKLQELEEMGGEVLYMQADVADLEQMRIVINEAEKKFGVIDGIIHAAGVTEGKSIRIINDLTSKDCRQQFQPKVFGVMVLNELFKDKPLDFCWLLSSISCVLGGLGFGAYASANCFMDAFAKKHNHLNGQNSFWLSLNWDGMDSSTSIDIFEKIFTLTKTGQLIVSRQGNLHQRIDRWIKLNTIKETDTAKEEGLSPAYPRPSLSSNYEAPRNPTEKTIADIWQHLLGFDAVGVKDDFLELGGDSLKAITLISRIQRESGVNIPVTEFFSHPTIERIAVYIRDSKNKSTYTGIESVEKKEYYLLSSAQLRIYILHRMDMESKGYNIPFVFELKGNVEPSKLEYSFKKLIKRHESFRTAFIMTPRGPAQVIHDDVDFSVEYLVCNETGVPGILANFVRPFDLETPPLMRIGMIKIDQDKHILILDIFHIITDGVSFDILLEEFNSIYQAIANGNESELAPLRIQYKDYAEWQKRLQQVGNFIRQKEYWEKEFEEEIPVLELPVDYARPAVQSFEGNSINFEINNETSSALKALALEAGATLYMVLLALYTIHLSRLTGQDDIVIGSPVAGRRHADLEKIIGMFVNTLALRNYPVGEKIFRDFLEEVKEKTLKAFENQDYQYEDLVEKVAVTRDTSRNPLFDTMFALQNTVSQKIDFHDMKFIPYEFEDKTSKFDLSLNGVEIEEKLLFTLEYSTKLFKQETIERFIVYFVNIIQGVVENRQQRISDFEMITEEEKKRILLDFNNTAAEYPKDKTIQQLFAEQVERTPDRIAVFCSTI
jgi:acyl transferase domain-containing protein/acyl carrier protein